MLPTVVVRAAQWSGLRAEDDADGAWGVGITKLTLKPPQSANHSSGALHLLWSKAGALRHLNRSRATAALKHPHTLAAL